MDTEDRLAIVLDALESLEEGFAILDDSGRLVASNQRYNDLLFAPGEEPKPQDSAISIVRRIVRSGRVEAFNQMDEDEAVLACLIDCYSCVRGAEAKLTDGRVIQVSSSPTGRGGFLMTFRDTGRDRIGERRAMDLMAEGLGSVDMGMILWDDDLTVQMVNAAWLRMIAEVSQGESARLILQRMLQEGRIELEGRAPSPDVLIADMHRGPLQFTYRSGAGAYAQVSTFPNSTGGVLATAVDITEERDAQDRAWAMLTDAVEALEVGVLHFDKGQTLRMMNRSAIEMVLAPGIGAPIGSTPQEIVEMLVSNGLYAPETATEEAAQRFWDAMQVHGVPLRVKWGFGKVLEFRSRPTDLGGLLVSVQDLTETVRANEAAREANELVRTIVDASPTTFLVSKVDTGEIVYSTAASEERFGKIESTLAFFLDPKDRQAYLEALLPTGRLTDYPVRFRRRDGSIMDGLTSARVIDYKGEKMIVSSTRDITDYLAMQAELAEQREIAAQNEKLSALGELLAGVAHELSNPMSVVLGYSMMLRDQVEDPKAKRRADRVAEASERCAKILKMFLSMARRRPAVLEPSDIGALVRDALEIPASVLKASGGTLRLDVAEPLPVVDSDGDQIIQVIINLAMNAIHAVEPLGAQGVIEVQAYAGAGDSVCVDVGDNGAGVPAEIRHRIFEPFFTTKDVGVGTGVGLAFCHRIVAAHGGQLTVGPSRLGGALFQVSLPAGGVGYQKPASARPDAATGPGGRVLVLDDEAPMGEMISDVLEEAGFHAEVFQSGLAAIRRCEAMWFDAILTDIRMPEISGQEFHSILSRTAPDQAERVIFLTGNAMNPEVEGFLKQCGRPYLEKPAIPARVIEAVRAVLGRQT